MRSFHQRYLAGEHESVWRELIALGPRVTEPILRSDARAVTREIVDRSFHNLRLLKTRLDDAGYMFEQPFDALREAQGSDASSIAYVEHMLGELPLILREWYGRIASVDFRQHRHQLYGTAEYREAAHGKALVGLGLNPVLLFLPLSRCIQMQSEIIDECSNSEMVAGKMSNLLPLGGYASNNEPKGVRLPLRSVDGVIYNDGAGDVDFVDELRLAFGWGGFPFWGRLMAGRRRFSSPIDHVPDFVGILPYLKADLKPI